MADLQHVIYIRTALELLFAALTDPEQTPHFFLNCRIEGRWEVGGDLSFVETSRGPRGPTVVKGQVVAIEPEQVLAYTFAIAQLDEGDSEVRFQLSRVPNATKLVVDHTGLVEASRTLALVTEGWPAILSSLKTWLETGEPLGLPQR